MRVELKLKSALRRGRGCNLWRWQRCFFFGLHCGCSRFCKQRSRMHVCVCEGGIWQQSVEKCAASLRCAALLLGRPLIQVFTTVNAQVCKCAHAHTHMHNIYMYVCKWEKSTMGVGSCHFACPCMSVHAYNTIFHVVFLCTIFTHFPYFSCSAK